MFVCVCICIKLHITAKSGPVIYSSYALLHVTHLGGYFVLFVDILARNARAYSHN